MDDLFIWAVFLAAFLGMLLLCAALVRIGEEVAHHYRVARSHKRIRRLE